MNPTPFACPGVFSVWVPGTPAPQGSKKAIPNYRGGQFTGRVSLVESSAARVRSWREDVRTVAAQTWASRPPLDDAVLLRVEFVLARPKATPKRTTPPAKKRPDLSKLLRSTEDALTSAGVYRDDCLIVQAVASKRLAEIGETTGAWIDLAPLTSTKEAPHGGE